MPRIEKAVFLSYRRTDGPWALNIYRWLTQHGYDVFFDYEGLGSGAFEQVILENIRSRAHFLVLLSPRALDRCKKPDDWLRREIEAAFDAQRNVVPLMIEGFDFRQPRVQARLVEKMEHLQHYNGLSIPSMQAFDSTMERLDARFLNVALESVPHPPSIVAAAAARQQQAAANAMLAESAELREAKTEVARLEAELEDVQMELAEYQCPLCGSGMTERSFYSECVHYDGHELDIEHENVTYSCGYSIDDGAVRRICTTSPQQQTLRLDDESGSEPVRP